MPLPFISACFHHDCFFFRAVLVLDERFEDGELPAPVIVLVFEFAAPVFFAAVWVAATCPERRAASFDFSNGCAFPFAGAGRSSLAA